MQINQKIGIQLRAILILGLLPKTWVEIASSTKEEN